MPHRAEKLEAELFGFCGSGKVVNDKWIEAGDDVTQNLTRIQANVIKELE